MHQDPSDNKPEEHTDDDTGMEEMIRLLRGFQAETERRAIVKRTRNARRQRVQKEFERVLEGFLNSDNIH